MQYRFTWAIHGKNLCRKNIVYSDYDFILRINSHVAWTMKLWPNIKLSPYLYGKSSLWGKSIWPQSYLCKGILYAGTTTPLHWNHPWSPFYWQLENQMPVTYNITVDNGICGDWWGAIKPMHTGGLCLVRTTVHRRKYAHDSRFGVHSYC